MSLTQHSGDGSRFATAPAFDGQPSLVIIPQHFGCLLFDHETLRYLPFDHGATDLLKQLRCYDFQRAVAALPPDQQSGAHEFCLWLEAAGLLDVNGRLPARQVDLTPPADHLAGPLLVHLEVVGACDLTCSHCFAGDLPRHQEPLCLDEIEALFDDLASIGVFRVSLTGGEPLLRTDLFDVIDAARTRGIHVGVTTNGMRITSSIAKAFGQRPDVRVNVSLEGAVAATNDAIRGAGSFQQVMRNLNCLREHAAFALAFTIRKQNVDEVRDCVTLAERCGAATAVFRPLYPVGHARLQPELMPTYAEYQRALQSLAKLNPRQSNAEWSSSPRVSGVDQCGAGKLTASISVQGVVNPCSFLGADFDTDSIRQRKFSKIWRESEGLRSIRQCSGSACAEGAELRDDHFTGGCRARSLVLIGDVQAADPWHRAHLNGEGQHPLATVEIQGGIRNDS